PHLSEVQPPTSEERYSSGHLLRTQPEGETGAKGYLIYCYFGRCYRFFFGFSFFQLPRVPGAG
ncbi:hypothetical protein CEXT_175411, partial [Caerostris extrusa]